MKSTSQLIVRTLIQQNRQLQPFKVVSLFAVNQRCHQMRHFSIMNKINEINAEEVQDK